MYLFISSVLMTLGHLFFIEVSYEKSFIKQVYILGCATSLVNHYHQSDSKIARYVDRTVMVLGAVNDLFYMRDSFTFSLWFSAIYFYVYSKVCKNVGLTLIVVPFHVISHACVTMCHAKILVGVVS